jgi:enoyl-CoA hydratase
LVAQNMKNGAVADATVELSVDGDGVALVTLNAPERRNAMDVAMVDEIVAIMDRVAADDAVGAVVVTGAGKGFCAGAALDHLADPGADAQAGLRAIYAGFLSFARCPKPTIAAVNGAAVGAGMNLALATDVRIASPAARFDARFLDLGLHPGGGHTWMLQRLIGPQAAAAAVLFGQHFSGEDAVRVGLAHECVDADQLLPRSLELAARAASMPRELSRRTKATFEQMWNVATIDDAVTAELDVQTWSLQQPDFEQRLAKFRKK